jgi:hypothetical protein
MALLHQRFIGAGGMALILVAALASASAPRDIAFDDTRVFPESLGASRDGTLYIGSWKGIVYRARPGKALATPWIKPSAENGLLTILGVLPDDRAGWVWVCSVPAPARNPPAPGSSALMAFDMKTGEQRLNLPFPARPRSATTSPWRKTEPPTSRIRPMDASIECGPRQSL